MIRVSSITTPLRRKILPVINVVALFVCVVCKYIFNLDYRILDMLILASSFSLFIYLILSRNLKIIYYENNFLLVDRAKLFLKDIISIKRRHFATYRIFFKTEYKMKSFIFIVDTIPFYTPDIIKEIKAKIKANNHS